MCYHDNMLSLKTAVVAVVVVVTLLLLSRRHSSLPVPFETSNGRGFVRLHTSVDPPPHLRDEDCRREARDVMTDTCSRQPGCNLYTYLDAAQTAAMETAYS